MILLLFYYTYIREPISKNMNIALKKKNNSYGNQKEITTPNYTF